MSYIEGFVAAVPRANKEIYRKFAADAAPIFKKFGATRMVENWGDDVPDGKITDFKGAVKAQPDEEIIFSWIEYPDKATRDKANERMMSDSAMSDMGEMPFDGKRMIFAGFEPVIDEGKKGTIGYIDGCVTPVPADKKEAYVQSEKERAALLKECGATRVVDAWGDDVPDGKVTDYKGAVKANADEKIVYSWIEWPSKEIRDKGWAKAMNDPRMQPNKMPFDGKRMIFGGFAPMLDV
ncbi:MAG: DUF1428 domain-containing protein [Candidatus Obscuribacterales bacterium]|nr:DUF1428 domain-containing protein [Steroidobacteraceae bacterium]